MASKISVSDEVYNLLTKIKGKDSYSKVIKILLENKSNKSKILEFYGSGGIDKKKLRI